MTIPSPIIMIVDDNDAMRSMIRRHVATFREDAYFVECENGVEAISAYSAFRPAWVLMDVKMPKLDGLNAARLIRKDFPNARIIIVSNFDDDTLKREAEINGAVGYVLKERLFELNGLMQ